MKQIKYARHAKRRMKERRVEESEAEHALCQPDFTEPAAKGRTNSYKFINGRYLRVTFKEEANHILIITVTIRKKPFKE